MLTKLAERHAPRTALALTAALTTALGALAVDVVGKAPTAHAYQTFNNHVLTGGVTGRLYWVDAAVPYGPAIVGAVGIWNATYGQTPILFSETGKKSASVMDFYYTNTPGYCAYTHMYSGSAEVNPNGSSWSWTRVYLDPILAGATCGGTFAKRKAIVAHEEGHAMGLAHALHSDRLMYAGIASTSVTAPIRDDINGINALY